MIYFHIFLYFLSLPKGKTPGISFPEAHGFLGTFNVIAVDPSVGSGCVDIIFEMIILFRYIYGGTPWKNNPQPNRL